MLSLAGAVVGIVAAAAALPLILRLTPVQIPRLDEASVDLRALGLGLAVVVVTTMFFGLVPALLLLRGQLVTGLEDGRARQLARRAPHLFGARRRRSRARVRAARQLGAAGAHGRPDDAARRPASTRTRW